MRSGPVNGVYQNKPSLYTEPISRSELRNALCAKNYEAGSVYSESYSEIRDLVKDTTVSQTNENSVYDIHTEVDGAARVGQGCRRAQAQLRLIS